MNQGSREREEEEDEDEEWSLIKDERNKDGGDKDEKREQRKLGESERDAVSTGRIL